MIDVATDIGDVRHIRITRMAGPTAPDGHTREWYQLTNVQHPDQGQYVQLSYDDLWSAIALIELERQKP